MKKLILTSSIALLVIAASSHAAIIDFDLTGIAGAGLLPGNEPGVIVGPGGTGGEIGAGISLDNLTHILTLNVGWGSSQGFNDLSSTASASHIHGPTASNNGAGFTQTAGVLITLNRSSSAVTGGVFTNGPITLTAAQETDLLNGKMYVNIHTGNNGSGELRGFLVPAPVPEPATAGLVAFGALALLRTRRNRA